METQKKIYKYDYPEQRVLSDQLGVGDKARVVELSPYAQPTIYAMCNGSRKMSDDVKSIIEDILLDRKKMQEKYMPAMAKL